jgi:putative redox protein
MVRIEVEYAGQLRCTATHGPSGAKLFTDAPVDNHGKGESFSPTDLVATALATCMATIMGIYAQRHDVDLQGMRLSVQKEMTTSGAWRRHRPQVAIHLPLPADHPQREALERAALACPVHHSLHPDVEKPIVFHWRAIS